jgi:hypothetical protein
MPKRPAPEILNAEGLFDFSTMKGIDVPDICIEAAEIASRLMQDDGFFESTVCKVLKDIAKDAGLSEPTQEETQNIRDNLRCNVHVSEDPDSYMQCSTYSADVFINRQVLLSVI